MDRTCRQCIVYTVYFEYDRSSRQFGSKLCTDRYQYEKQTRTRSLRNVCTPMFDTKSDTLHNTAIWSASKPRWLHGMSIQIRYTCSYDYICIYRIHIYTYVRISSVRLADRRCFCFRTNQLSSPPNGGDVWSIKSIGSRCLSNAIMSRDGEDAISKKEQN